MRCGLALGSNLGDRVARLREAVRRLGLPVVAKSSVYETAPVDCADDDPAFANAVVEIDFDGSPGELLARTQAIEIAMGRPADHPRNAPRTIDLDIALYDDNAFDYTPADGRPRHVPDPDLRRFLHCLQPVADLLPDMPHPETGEALGRLAERLQRDAETSAPTLWPRPDVDARLEEPR